MKNRRDQANARPQTSGNLPPFIFSLAPVANQHLHAQINPHGGDIVRIERKSTCVRLNRFGQAIGIKKSLGLFGPGAGIHLIERRNRCGGTILDGAVLLPKVFTGAV